MPGQTEHDSKPKNYRTVTSLVGCKVWKLNEQINTSSQSC